jgi:hypothetical protein
MIQGFLFGVLFITFTIGISYIIGEYVERKDEKQNRRQK